MSFLSPRTERGATLIIDIRSGSVGAALARLGGPHPEILYTVREEFPFQHESRGARLTALVRRTLAHVMLAVTAEGMAQTGLLVRQGVIREAIVILSPPWIASKTTFLELSQQEPIRITERVLLSLLQHNAQAHEGPAEKEMQVEEKLIKAALNGYETRAPLGKTAAEATFVLRPSFADAALIRGIEETIIHFLHLPRVSFHSFSLAAFAAARELLPEAGDVLLLTIDSELSELSVVKKQVLLESVTFPMGSSHFLRLLHTTGGVPISGAETLMRLSVEDRDAGERRRERNLVSRGEADWSRQFLHALSSLSKRLILPRLVCLTAPEDTAALLTETVRKNDVGQFTLASEPLTVRYLGDEFLSPFVSWQSTCRHDSPLALETVFSRALRR